MQPVTCSVYTFVAHEMSEQEEPVTTALCFVLYLSKDYARRWVMVKSALLSNNIDA